jgi:hypothetical protein
MLIIEGLPSPLRVQHCDTSSKYMMQQVLCHLQLCRSSESHLLYLHNSLVSKGGHMHLSPSCKDPADERYTSVHDAYTTKKLLQQASDCLATFKSTVALHHP